MSKNTTDEIKTLTNAIAGIDASRRVGWAKAFAAEESADEAHRIAALTAEDRTAYRRGASYLWGILSGLTDDLDAGEIKDEIFTETGELAMILDDGVVARGRSRGKRLAERIEAIGQKRLRKEEAKRVRRRSAEKAQKVRKSGRAWGLATLMQDYGFESDQQLYEVLRKWRKATGATPHRRPVQIGNRLHGRNGRTVKPRKSTP